MNHDPKKILSGAGFYAVLLLCLAAVGTASYFLLFRGGNGRPALPDSSAEESIVTAAQSDEERVTAAIADTDIPERTENTPVSMPEKAVEDEPRTPTVIDNTPVVAEAPALMVAPLEGEVVSAFSVDALQYDKTMGDWRTHAGVDIAAAAGTGVLAASAGQVISVTDDALMGTTVVLDHVEGYETTYANLQKDPAVAKGDTVSAGQVIGAVGETSLAEAAEGPHLHFSVTKDGDVVDPEVYLKK